MPESKQQLKGLLKTPENTEIFEITSSVIWVDEYGIVCAVPKNRRRKIEHFEEMFAFFAKLMEGKSKLCLLIEADNEIPLRNEVRDYIATELPKYIKAHAVVSVVPLERTLSTTFIRLNEVGIPINLFSNEKEAKEWLKTFL
jgi:hypothetical protein